MLMRAVVNTAVPDAYFMHQSHFFLFFIIL